MTALLLVIGGAAVLRLNRLAMTDTITEPVRQWIATHAPRRSVVDRLPGQRRGVAQLRPVFVRRV